MPRWILVDDTDSGIQYTGPWFEDQSSQDSLGNFGIPYLSTLHGINSDGSFSYSFRGSRVLITATLQFPSISGASEGPSWQCIVDGVPIPSIVYTVPENRLRFCEQDGLADDGSLHTIVVHATVPGQRTFWFDYIQYLPSADVPLDNAALSIDVPDPEMQFGAGWGPHSVGYMTTETGSTFTFPFNGVSITWFGFYDNSLPMTATTATYAIDGGKPTAFNLNGISASATGVQYNQIFFQTPQLPAGEHTLAVAYQGNSQTTPLTLNVLYLQNGTSSSASTVSTSLPFTPPIATLSFSTASSTSISLPTTSSPTQAAASVSGNVGNSSFSRDSNQIGVIVGGTLGALAILFLIVGFWLYRRWKPRQAAQMVDQRPVSDMSQLPRVDPYIYATASAAAAPSASRWPISPMTSTEVVSASVQSQHGRGSFQQYEDPFQDTASQGISEVPRAYEASSSRY